MYTKKETRSDLIPKSCTSMFQMQQSVPDQRKLLYRERNTEEDSSAAALSNRGVDIKHDKYGSNINGIEFSDHSLIS